MAIRGGKGYTIADIEALPPGKRAELIDGEMFQMDTPFGVYIKKDNRNYVEPDISVICDREKLDQKGYHGAPDWAIEIVSPSSVKMDTA